MAGESLPYETCFAYYEQYRDEANALETAVSNLEGLLSDLQSNLDQLKVVKDSQSGLPQSVQIIKDSITEGEQNFIEGAMYCGQEIGGSEQFANIGTSVDNLKNHIDSFTPLLESKISTYEDSISKVNTKIEELNSDISSAWENANYYRGLMNSASS
jgi:chaperonin cofactor prefoldin